MCVGTCVCGIYVMWYGCEHTYNHVCGMYVCGVMCACVCVVCVCVGMVSDCFFVFLGHLPIFQGLGHGIVSNLTEGSMEVTHLIHSFHPSLPFCLFF